MGLFFVIIGLSALSFISGWMIRGAREQQKAWRRGLYEHSQYTSKDEVSNADDNPPGSL